DPGPPDPGPPAPSPPTDPPAGLYGTSVQLGLQSSWYTMYMLSNKFGPSILDNSQNAGGGIALSKPPHQQSDFRRVSYEESSSDRTGSNDPANCQWDQGCCLDRHVWFTGYGVGGVVDSDGTSPGARYGLGAVQIGIERETDPGTIHGL